MGALAQQGVAAWVTAVLLWPVVSMLPGYLVVTALDPARRTLERWAVAPLVSIALAFVPAIWIDRLRPGSGLTVAGASLLLCSVAAVAVLRRRRTAVLVRPGRLSRPLVVLGVVMAVAFVLGAAVVLRSAGGLDTVVPNDDGNGHGWFVTRILLTGSVDMPTVTTVDPLSPPTAGFYPLGLHLLAALVGAPSAVTAALVVVGVLAGAVWAPLAIAALARRVGSEVVGVVAGSLLAVATPWYPLGQMAWGGWTLIVAVALVPAAVLAVLDVSVRFRGRREGVAMASSGVRREGGVISSNGRSGLIPLEKTTPPSRLASSADSASSPIARASRPRGTVVAVAVLALVGVLAVHISELVVVGVLVGLTVLLARPGLRGVLRDAAWMLGCAAVALVLLLPLVVRIGAATAVGQVDSTSMGAWQALVEVVQKPYFGFEGPEPAAAVLWTVWGVVAIVVLAAGSVSLWRRSPVARGVVAGTWVFLVLAILAYTGHGSMLTVPWYGSGNRLLVQACALGVVPTAAATVGAARWVAGRGSRVLAAAAVAGVVLLGGMLVARTVQMGDTSFRRAMVTSDHVAAFRWLAAHSAPGERVLNDPRAGTVWVYESTGGAVAPVFGPKHDWRTDPVWAGRVYLQDHVAQAGSDPRVAEEATRWGVRYVLVGPSVVPGGTPTLDPAALAEASGLREVFRSGDVRVYELAR